MQIFLYLCSKFVEYEKNSNRYCFIILEHYVVGAVEKRCLRSVH